MQYNLKNNLRFFTDMILYKTFRGNIVMNNLPESAFYNGFYIWFDFNNKREYYAAPLYLYNTVRKDIDASNMSINILSDVSKYKPKKDDVLIHPTSIVVHYSESIGMLLLRLLNADFTSFESAYNTFLYAYGFELLKKYSDLSLSINYASEKKFLEAAKDFYDDIKEKLLSIQEAFRNCVNFVYNLEDTKEYADNLYVSKFIAYTIKDDSFYEFSRDLNVILDNYTNIHHRNKNKSLNEILNELENNNSNLNLKNYYTSNNLASICYAILNELVKYDYLPIKKCQNCDRYFIPTVRQTEIYCDLENIDGSSTCREMGASLTYKKKLQEVPALGVYRQVYQKKVMAVYRNPDDTKLKDEFDKWKKETQEKIRQFKKGEITEEKLNKWMDKNM